MYKCSRESAPGHAAGIRWNDPALKIKWPVKDPRLSPKDRALPFLED